MKYVFIAIFSLLLVAENGAHSYAPKTDLPSGGGDHLPWPWGTECPFPWNNIEGVWKAQKPNKRNSTTVEGYYEFNIVSEWENGTHVFEVKKYSEDGGLIGEGRGYAPKDQKIVRAIVLSPEKMDLPNHRVIVRAYKEVATSACGKNLVTVLTARPMSNSKEEEIHYVLLKDEGVEK